MHFAVCGLCPTEELVFALFWKCLSYGLVPCLDAGRFQRMASRLSPIIAEELAPFCSPEISAWLELRLKYSTISESVRDFPKSWMLLFVLGLKAICYYITFKLLILLAEVTACKYFTMWGLALCPTFYCSCQVMSHLIPAMKYSFYICSKQGHDSYNWSGRTLQADEPFITPNY